MKPITLNRANKFSSLKIVFDKVKFTRIASQIVIKIARECIKNNN